MGALSEILATGEISLRPEILWIATGPAVSPDLPSGVPAAVVRPQQSQNLLPEIRDFLKRRTYDLVQT